MSLGRINGNGNRNPDRFLTRFVCLSGWRNDVAGIRSDSFFFLCSQESDGADRAPHRRRRRVIFDRRARWTWTRTRWSDGCARGRRRTWWGAWSGRVSSTAPGRCRSAGPNAVPWRPRCSTRGSLRLPWNGPGRRTGTARRVDPTAVRTESVVLGTRSAWTERFRRAIVLPGGVRYLPRGVETPGLKKKKGRFT